jgi:hypothetical protein
MSSRVRFRILLVYPATIYALSLLFFCRVIPDWGKWYSTSSYYRDQAAALLRGNFAISHNPADLRMDLCWAQNGVQQVWGLGVPTWELPFDLLGRFFGLPTFPERIALGCFMALAAYVVCKTWISSPQDSREESRLRSRAPVIVGTIALVLFFAPLTNLLRGPMNHYEEAVVYVYYFAILLACGLITLTRSPSWRRFWLLCVLAGIGGLIRPTLVFYGFATLAVASLVMFSHERQLLESRSPIARWLQFFRNPKLLLGVLLFVFGGGLLFITNFLRFGSGWEFGHRLNASSAIPSIYSTRFDYPFKHEPVGSAARELFGMLFLTDRFNNVAWYAQGIFPGQSPTIRKRGVDMTTYDLGYAVLLVVAWGIGLWLMGKRLRSRRTIRTAERSPQNQIIPEHLLVILWSMATTVPLLFFYLRTPVISDRYMLDLSPAFALAFVGLWSWSTSIISINTKHSQCIIVALLVTLLGWQASEIVRGKNAFGTPHSIDAKELASQSKGPTKPPPSLPDEYKIGDAMETWKIQYNGQGWNADNGEVGSCAIFYVDSPEFLDLELAPATGSRATETSLTAIQAKVGREFLKRNSITSTNGSWVLRFEAPRQSRYQKGIQPVFLAMVSSSELGDHVLQSAPWTLKRISWRKE